MLQTKKEKREDDEKMSYHQTAEEFNGMAKSLQLTPEHINLMIRFGKLVRRSARQNKVLWNIVETMLKDTGLKLELYQEKDGDNIYDKWRVVKV